MTHVYPVAIVKLTIRKNRSFVFMLRDPFSNPRKWIGNNPVREGVTSPQVQKRPLRWNRTALRTRLAIEACEGPLLDFLWTARGVRGYYSTLMSKHNGCSKFSDEEITGFRQASSVSGYDQEWHDGMGLRMTFDALRVTLRVSIACGDFETIHQLQTFHGIKPKKVDADDFLDPFGFDLEGS